jgi:hypothetical protein
VSITAAYQKEKQIFQSPAVSLKGKDPCVATITRGEQLTTAPSGRAISGRAAAEGRPLIETKIKGFSAFARL